VEHLYISCKLLEKCQKLITQCAALEPEENLTVYVSPQENIKEEFCFKGLISMLIRKHSKNKINLETNLLLLNLSDQDLLWLMNYLLLCGAAMRSKDGMLIKILRSPNFSTGESVSLYQSLSSIPLIPEKDEAYLLLRKSIIQFEMKLNSLQQEIQSQLNMAKLCKVNNDTFD
jgi:hypothetical protein